MTPRLRDLAVLAVVLALLWPPAAAGQVEKAGVVSTARGTVTAGRPAAPEPVALGFKDDVFLQDRIITGERSLARLLLGGRALVTVRERSVLTITEVPGRSTINLQSGKIGLAVARDKMGPGDRVEVRTPNAVAGVRGTYIVVETETRSDPVTNVWVLEDRQKMGADFERLDPATGRPLAPPAPLLDGQALTLVGAQPPTIVQMTAADRMRAESGLAAAPPHTQAANQQQLAAQQMQQAAELANALAEDADAVIAVVAQAEAAQKTAQETIKVQQEAGTSTSDIGVNEPPATDEASTFGFVPGPPATPFADVAGGNLIVNGSFETGTFAGWTAAGAAAVIDSLGPFGPDGSFMALIHTGPGAVGETTSTLSQTVSVASVLLIKFAYAFLTNEFPTQSVDDFFRVSLIDSDGVSTELAFESRFSTEADDKFQTTDTDISAGGFTLFAGNGFTEFINVSTTRVVPAGETELLFEVRDASDTIVDSAALIDVVQIVQDPPLFFLRDGEHVVRTDSTPLLDLDREPRALDSLLVVCCESSLTLNGPLLRAAASDLDVEFSLVSLIQGGVLATTTAEPLVQVEGGVHRLGALVGVFDLAGDRHAVDPATGLSLGTDRPLRHEGALLDAGGATIVTERLLKIDTALLEATLPALINLRKGSKVLTAESAAELSQRAKVTSLGPLFRLDGSLLAVARGAAVNVARGSVLDVGGDLFQLLNGSTLSLLNGPVLSVSGGSIASIGGALVVFGGSGGNTVNVANNLCNPCQLLGGIPVALTGGAAASNVKIGGAITGGDLGSVNLSNPTLGSGGTALVVVTGSSSKLNVGPK